MVKSRYGNLCLLTGFGCTTLGVLMEGFCGLISADKDDADNNCGSGSMLCIFPAIGIRLPSLFDEEDGGGFPTSFPLKCSFVPLGIGWRSSLLFDNDFPPTIPMRSDIGIPGPNFCVFTALPPGIAIISEDGLTNLLFDKDGGSLAPLPPESAFTLLCIITLLSSKEVGSFNPLSNVVNGDDVSRPPPPHWLLSLVFRESELSTKMGSFNPLCNNDEAPPSVLLFSPLDGRSRALLTNSTNMFLMRLPR
mmetsp:Transcript_32380/g.61958  ORF Transcript_32380/g.61958 Transcript_32380/m.61958 type:complete len:249 (+) Transcript_32380:1530-2276(+)